MKLILNKIHTVHCYGDNDYRIHPVATIHYPTKTMAERTAAQMNDTYMKGVGEGLKALHSIELYWSDKE